VRFPYLGNTNIHYHHQSAHSLTLSELKIKMDCKEVGVGNVNMIDVANENAPRKLFNFIQILSTYIFCVTAVM
jgi:hypothetical protein